MLPIGKRRHSRLGTKGHHKKRCGSAGCERAALIVGLIDCQARLVGIDSASRRRRRRGNGKDSGFLVCPLRSVGNTVAIVHAWVRPVEQPTRPCARRCAIRATATVDLNDVARGRCIAQRLAACKRH